MMRKGLAAGAILATLAACVPNAASNRPAAVTSPLPAPRPPAQPPTVLAATPHAPAALNREIGRLGAGFDGRAGIAVLDIDAGWSASFNGDQPMPQQSVSKLWVAVAALDALDRGAMRLNDPVTVTRADLTLFHQPIRANVGAGGYATTIGALLNQAMTRSDNTANDMLLWKVGGPEAVRGLLMDRGVRGVRFGPGERLLQSRIAGLEWRQDYAIGNGFLQARAALPAATRSRALDAYLDDPMDGATPLGIVDGLAKLQRGRLLSPASTRLLINTMTESRTGPQRLKAGLGAGWTAAHKTGTGQELGSLATGYNDVAIITSPNGHSYAVAVMIASTRQSIPVRQKLMADVVRAVVAQDAVRVAANMGDDRAVMR